MGRRAIGFTFTGDDQLTDATATFRGHELSGTIIRLGPTAYLWQLGDGRRTYGGSAISRAVAKSQMHQAARRIPG